jgi:hypothetical protein
VAKNYGWSVKQAIRGLRRKGMSKSRAAAIANSPGSSSRGGSSSGSSQSRGASGLGSGGNRAQKAPPATGAARSPARSSGEDWNGAAVADEGVAVSV